ncbi:MAG: hypothetical protein HC888_18570 [Candidatus Competibacteraceae bacterium]|nr:hypothetical protein [Candidatus Competibacteraceae bacterium]
MAWNEQPDSMKADMIRARDEGLLRKGITPNSGCLGVVLGWVMVAWAVMG